ncbi:MAG: ATP-binding cassette domain-containing protein [Bacteroidetes bacterium]|nr:ATP-binding cassette domain-containing protein [Bacteroidota bacterium]
MSLELKNLEKIYGNQKAIDNISFTLQKGEIVGFLGPNGAGKSTTLKVITGYLQPQKGEVFIGGIKASDNPLMIKQKIGYLPESNALYYDMYVREYLSFIAGVHRIPEYRKAINHVIDITGLSLEYKKKIGQLSKGYKQRVGLAAALIHQPELLILDEPTSGLDPNQIVEIRNVIKEQGKNKTVLFSSHVLQEVQAICDRVIIIHHGKIVADNDIQTLGTGLQKRRVKITFEEKLDKTDFNNISGLQQIDQVNPHQWSLLSDDANFLKKQLLELAIQQNLNIQSLEVETSNLEEIFRLLTKN